MDWAKEIRHKAQGSTDLVFWLEVANELERLMKSRHELDNEIPTPLAAVQAEPSEHNLAGEGSGPVGLGPRQTGPGLFEGCERCGNLHGCECVNGVGHDSDLLAAAKDARSVLRLADRSAAWRAERDRVVAVLEAAIDQERPKSGTQMCPSCGMRFRPHGDGMGADLYGREEVSPLGNETKEPK